MQSLQVVDMNDLKIIRKQIRSGEFFTNTSGVLPGLVQGNVVILPKVQADQFVEFCKLNPKPCPIIGVSEPGDFSIPALGDELDIRHDIPEYHIFEDGEFVRSNSNVEASWEDDSVAIVLGCSFSFEQALQDAGIPVRNIDLNLNVSMYDTTIPLKPTEHYSGSMVVSMRPFKHHQIDDVIEITSSFNKSHGAPIHIGDPAEIGIKNINMPEYGDAVPIEVSDILVFWGCGVTTQRVLRESKLPFLITHAPGKMLITDFDYESLTKRI
jgi:uncharacterized protein YcsI (UPF0317 family)